MTRNDPQQPQLPYRRHGRQERGSSRAALEVPKAAVVDRRFERVAAASKRSNSSSSHRAGQPRRMHFPQTKVDKSIVDVTRKRTSFTYLSTKLHGMFRREHRDTIACEEDEEPPARNRSLRDLYRLGTTSSRAVPTATTHVDDMGTGSSPTTCATTAATALVTSGPSPAVLVEHPNQPSREQRWCTNCSKCFQRGLSRYDQYCGLDCKTAHRMRQIA